MSRSCGRLAMLRCSLRLQAQKGQMEEQLAAIAAQMQQLKTDNGRIASRNNTLEKVLFFKESEIAQLQDKHKIFDTEPEDTSSASAIARVPHKAASALAKLEQIVQDYRSIVNVMANLLLRLDEEDDAQEVAEQLRAAVRSS
ncbi:hypothetical protein MMC08_007562, partial [Hypocenomyce scalaris]|nr:hypothetical protein [Hypocenomyce scalaris]